jgi:hypothetical protein
VTKPGNSDPAEPTADAAPEPTGAGTEAAETTPESPTAPAGDPASPPSSHESPTRAPGGPPNSTLPESTDNSGSSDAVAEDGTDAKDEPAESAAAGKAESAAKAKPAAKAESADRESAESAEPESAESVTPEEVAPAETRGRDRKANTAKSSARARAEAAAAAEDPEPLMAELEKAPPLPKAEALRTQAKRRFEEPPPRMLRFSFYFFSVAGIIWVLLGIFFLINKQTIVDAQMASGQTNGLSREQVALALTRILWIFLVLGVVFAAFLTLFGYKATEGIRRARTLVTIFSVILVIFHFLLFSTTYGTLCVLCALIGLFLLWTPSSRAYFPPRQVP